jgi:hypothetical protein
MDMKPQDLKPSVGYYCTPKQVEYIRRLAGTPTLDVVNRIRASKGKPPIDHLGAMHRVEASEIIECLSAGTTTSP